VEPLGIIGPDVCLLIWYNSTLLGVARAKVYLSEITGFTVMADQLCFQHKVYSGSALLPPSALDIH
jgi:hypothetical protein